MNTFLSARVGRYRAPPGQDEQDGGQVFAQDVVHAGPVGLFEVEGV